MLKPERYQQIDTIFQVQPIKAQKLRQDEQDLQDGCGSGLRKSFLSRVIRSETRAKSCKFCKSCQGTSFFSRRMRLKDDDLKEKAEEFVAGGAEIYQSSKTLDRMNTVQATRQECASGQCSYSGS